MENNKYLKIIAGATPAQQEIFLKRKEPYVKAAWEREAATAWREAVKYCEEHECQDCKIYNLPDCRTDYEKCVLRAPCCINLVPEYLRSV